MCLYFYWGRMRLAKTEWIKEAAQIWLIINPGLKCSNMHLLQLQEPVIGYTCYWGLYGVCQMDSLNMISKTEKTEALLFQGCMGWAVCAKWHIALVCISHSALQSWLVNSIPVTTLCFVPDNKFSQEY